MSEARWITADVFEAMAAMPDGSVDLIVTSPPFLALRSYLPDGHPDKHLEIGSEATPAAFLSTLLRLTQEWRRLLAPHGSICVELGDTYSGSGGAGGDYNGDGLRDGQPKFDGSAKRGKLATYADARGNPDGMRDTTFSGGNTRTGGGPGWPLAKSLCGIPDAYHLSLIYGRNILNPTEQFEPWRVRNKIVWHRPNPPVGALGDKVRPSTSYITVACVSKERWFDLDSERTALSENATNYPRNERPSPLQSIVGRGDSGQFYAGDSNPAGAPLLDCWTIPTQPYSGAHYATFPQELPKRLINLMCPLQVCTVCGEPRRRIVESERHLNGLRPLPQAVAVKEGGYFESAGTDTYTVRTTLGWTDCDCSVPAESDGREASGKDGSGFHGYPPSIDSSSAGTKYRRGHVLDPFAGSGTTLAVATGLGRDATGIDIDARNLDLARERIGLFLTEDEVVA